MNGSKWIRRERRLAIYLRDGLSCMWCGVGIETPEVCLTLDHCNPRSKGGTNETTNLVTSCARCNSVRQDRPLQAFAQDVTNYVQDGVSAEDRLQRIKNHRRLSLKKYMSEAKELIKRRGTYTSALNSLR